MSKIEINNIYKIFGNKPQSIMPMVKDGATKEDVLEQTGHTVGLDNVSLKIEEGATLVAGGPGKPEGLNAGYFVKPTVFADVRNDMTIAQEEVFGPVLSILPYKDDEDAYWDTLDGETDVLDLVGSALEDLNAADGDIEKLSYLIKIYSDRRDIVKYRKDSIKRGLQSILAVTGQKKIPHALATVSLREGSERVMITNPEEIPSQLCKVTRTPDKAEIKKQLLAGEKIEGASLETGPSTISVRMK